MLRICVYKANLKFSLEDTLMLIENESLNFFFNQNGITGDLELKKLVASPWADILKTPLNHDCRFSKINKDGSAFIKCYIHFRKSNVKTDFNQKINIIERQFTNDHLCCSLKLVVSKETIYNRLIQHNKASFEGRQLQKQRDKNNKTVYVCHNPKPYQGGGFTPK